MNSTFGRLLFYGTDAERLAFTPVFVWTQWLSTDTSAIYTWNGVGWLTISAPGGSVSGSGTIGIIAQWVGLTTLGDSSLAKTGAGLLTLSSAGAYTLTVPATGTAVLGTGVANRLTAWVDDHTIGISGALTTVGDLPYFASLGATELNSEEVNDLTLVEYTTGNVIIETVTVPGVVTGDTVRVTVDVWSSARSGWQAVSPMMWHFEVRKNTLAGPVIMSSDHYDGRAPYLETTGGHDFEWADLYDDASPSTGTYVLVLQAAGGYFGNGSIYSDTRHLKAARIASGAGPNRLPIGSEDQFLRVSSGLPEWETVTVITDVDDTASVDLTLTGHVLSAAVLPAGVDHNSLLNYAANRHFLQTDIDHLSTALTTGLVKVTTVTGALSVVTDNSANWDTAFGWGNHASAGYALASNVIANSLLTTRGDLIRRGASAPERYGLVVPAAGTLNYLGVNNGEVDPTWKSASSNPGAAAAMLQSTTAGYLQLVRLGIGIAPVVGISLLGTSAQSIRAERNTTADTAGQALTLQVGGSTSASTDKNGGTLQLVAGTSTGIGTSSITLATAPSTNAATVATISLGAGGTGYTAGDVLTLTGGGGNATVTVNTVTAGVVTTFTLTAGGTGYGLTNLNPTTGGTGTGATFNILTLTGTGTNNSAAKITILGNGSLTLAPNIVDVSGTPNAISLTVNISAPYSSGAQYRSLYVSNKLGANSSSTETYTGTTYGLFVEGADIRTSGLIAGVTSFQSYAAVLRSTAAATTQMTLGVAGQFVGLGRFSGTSTLTMGNLYLTNFDPAQTAGLTVSGTTTMINLSNGTAAFATNNFIGIDIAALTRATSLNAGIRIATPSGATANYALQLSGTGGTPASGITFSTDVTLYRSAANILTTDDQFSIIGSGDWIQLDVRKNATQTADLARFGDGTTNYAAIEADGTLKFVGTATFWKDIDFPLVAKTTGANTPSYQTLIGNLTMLRWAVSDVLQCDTEEFVHEWKEASPATWHIHVITNGLDASNRYIRFEIEYTWANFSTVLPATTTITSADMLIPASTTDRTHFIFDIGSFTPTGGKIGAHVKARVKRVAAVGTAPTNDPFAELVQLHIECDTLGSRAITTK